MNEDKRILKCQPLGCKGGRLIQVKITKKDKHRTATGWPGPLNRGGRLIQVTNTAFVWEKNRDFENWPLIRGWSLNTGPLYTGSTVIKHNDNKAHVYSRKAGGDLYLHM